MPLQNRVDPLGAIAAVEARGLFTGNRGIIHDPVTRTLLKRRWSTKAWIICECEFRGRRRDVMGLNGRKGGVGWTELFFLDEVTALAAGHRPCFYCRSDRARAFAQCFAAGQGGGRLSAPEIDARLHRERRASSGPAEHLDPEKLVALPDGAVLEGPGDAYAVRRGALLPWSFAGYGPPRRLDGLETDVTLVTPPSTMAALRRGYKPVWHPSAGT